jgi:hypothetical protein
MARLPLGGARAFHARKCAEPFLAALISSASILVASAAATLPFVFPRGFPCALPCGTFNQVLKWSFYLGLAWVPLACAAIAISRRGRRWLLLLAAPVAFFWPLSLAFVFLVAPLFGPTSGFPLND